MGKIPKNAQLVYQGEIFAVYNWQQQMYDGSRQTFEMIKRTDTAEIIAVQDNKILISEQEQPSKGKYYSLYGGQGEINEFSLETAQRELLEESGLSSEQWELFHETQLANKIEWTIYTYIARDCQKVAEVKLDPGEKITQISLNFPEFIDFIISDKYNNNSLKVKILKLIQSGDKLEEFKFKLFNHA